jgi:hypothetical protein
MGLDNHVEPPCANKTTVSLVSVIHHLLSPHDELSETYYALGKDKLREAMTSAMQIVADLETPTRQCTKVAVPSNLPFSVTSYEFPACRDRKMDAG